MHCRKLEFNDGDYVMVRIRPERCPKHYFKKNFARACGPYHILKRLDFNAYLIDLTPDLSINHVFNVEDLTLYRGTFESPIFFASVTGGVKVILEDEIVSTATGGFQQFLVRGKGRPQSDNNWVHEDDMRCIDPNLLGGYLQANCPRVSFSKPGRDDGTVRNYFRKKYKNNNYDI